MSSSVPAADQGAPSLLLGIPRECRHIVFEHVAGDRDIKPRDTLRNWFEKQDIQEQIAEKMKDADLDVTFVAGYNHQYADEQDSDAEDEQEDAAADDQDGADDEEEIEEGDELADFDYGDFHDPDYGLDDDDVNISYDDDSDSEGEHAGPNYNAQSAAATLNAFFHMDGQDVVADSNQESDEEAEAEDVERVDADEDETALATSTETDPNTPAPNVVVVKPHSKWRHVSKFMRLTQCPPETNLFLISKQINDEVKAWFYDVAILKIDATASFLHFSFFELALNKLAGAAFSPMENIKKAEITFVWDTTWIRAEESGFAGSVFPVFLKNRVDFIIETLLRAPELETILIHWHDSAEDDGAKQLRADTIEPFILQLNANVDTVDHYIAPDAKPHAKSRAGKQRLEFKAIMDNGCETF